MFLFTLIGIYTFSSADENVKDVSPLGLPEGAIARLGKGSIEDMDISPDGKQLTVASSIGIWLYDPQTGNEITLFTGHESFVRSVAFSPDGITLASGSGLGSDKSIRLWDIRTGKHKTISNGSSGDVRTLAYSPDGNTLASGGHDGTILHWNLP